jgi:hypothetical protein
MKLGLSALDATLHSAGSGSAVVNPDRGVRRYSPATPSRGAYGELAQALQVVRPTEAVKLTNQSRRGAFGLRTSGIPGFVV